MTPEDLKLWREQASISQADLAARLGVHEQTISKYERGTLKIPNLVRWALYGLMTDHARGRKVFDAGEALLERPSTREALDKLGDD